jgi:hypothetical protein
MSLATKRRPHFHDEAPKTLMRMKRRFGLKHGTNRGKWGTEAKNRGICGLTTNQHPLNRWSGRGDLNPVSLMYIQQLT